MVGTVQDDREYDEVCEAGVTILSEERIHLDRQTHETAKSLEQSKTNLFGGPHQPPHPGKRPPTKGLLIVSKTRKE